MIPRIVLTPGEPAGIGPDLSVLVAQNEYPCELVAFSDPDLLSARAGSLGVPLELIKTNLDYPPVNHQPGKLKIVPTPLKEKTYPGVPDKNNVHYLLKSINRAVKACTDRKAHGLVTGPVHKSLINEAGIPFTGHTEYLAEITGGTPVMMLSTTGLRVALATTHLPLSKVSEAITHQRIRAVLRVLYQDLTVRFGVENPRILVCGLNPHAGEQGHLGREEVEIIEPVLRSLCAQGLQLQGPLSADTLFTPKYLENADAVLAMYHDQGLPVLKHMGFGRSVNITLGLSIIRTSVDHGTALDLAGTGKIDPGSLNTAIQTAIELSKNEFRKDKKT